MIADRVHFACLQFPREWDSPKFQIGQTVVCDDGVGVIVGATYESLQTHNPEFDTAKFGWWFFICIHSNVDDLVLKDVIGHHQDVIQPVYTAVEDVSHCIHRRDTDVCSDVIELQPAA